MNFNATLTVTITTDHVCDLIRRGVDIAAVVGLPGSRALFNGDNTLESPGFENGTHASPACVAAKVGNLAALKQMHAAFGDEVLLGNAYAEPERNAMGRRCRQAEGCDIAAEAAGHGHLHVVRYLVETLGLRRVMNLTDDFDVTVMGAATQKSRGFGPASDAVNRKREEVAVYLARAVIAEAEADASATAGTPSKFPGYAEATALLAASAHLPR